MASFTFIFTNNATQAKKTGTGYLPWTLSLWVLFHLLSLISILYSLPCFNGTPAVSLHTQPLFALIHQINRKDFCMDTQLFLWLSSLSGLVKPQALSLAFLWFPDDTVLFLPGFQSVCWETSFLSIQKNLCTPTTPSNLAMDSFLFKALPNL